MPRRAFNGSNGSVGQQEFGEEVELCCCRCGDGRTTAVINQIYVAVSYALGAWKKRVTRSVNRYYTVIMLGYLEAFE